MPPVAAAAAAAAMSGAMAAAAGTTILGLTVMQSAIVIGLSSFALSMATTMLTPKPKLGGLNSGPVGRTELIRAPSAPRRIVYGRQKVGGNLVFIENTGTNNKYMHMVVAVASHEIDGFESFFLSDDEVPIGPDGFATDDVYGDLVRVKYHLGADDQFADPDLMEEIDRWTHAHRLRGIAYAYVRLEFNARAFPNGLPQPRFVIRGRKVFDPRDNTVKYTDNAALVIRDYVMHPLGFGAAADEVDDERFKAEADICDEPVPLATGGTEPRYTINGMVDTSEKTGDVLRRMLGACAGRLAGATVYWGLFTGAYRGATMDLTEDEMAGSIKVQTRQSLRDTYNAVKGTFIDPEAGFQETDFPPIMSETFRLQDMGVRRFDDVDLGMTASASAAQRIGKISLLQARQPIRVTVPLKLHGLLLRCGDVVRLTFKRFGWIKKQFEVRAWALQVQPAGGVSIAVELAETDASIYDWNTSEEQAHDPAPNSNLPSPFVVGQPTGIDMASGTDQLFMGADGTIVSRMAVAISPAADGFVTGYDLRWRPLDEPEFDNQVRLTDGGTRYRITGVRDGVMYEVQARSRNGMGAVSPWIRGFHQVVGKIEPPDAPDTFTVQRMPDGTRRFSWTHDPVPADVRSGGGYLIRYAPGAVTDWDLMTPLHEGVHTASPLESNDLSAGEYSFAIKAVDSSGNQSVNARFVNLHLGDPRLRGALFQFHARSSGWPGTLAGGFVDTGGGVSAKGLGTWDDLPNTWDALAGTWQGLNGVAGTIEYLSPVFDLGADLSYSALVNVAATGSAVVEMRTGSDADGDAIGAWSAPGVIQAQRYAQVRVTVTDATPAITELSFIADGETGIDAYEDINTATETAPVFHRVAAGQFRLGARGGLATISQARIVAIQNAGAGFSWDLVSKIETVNGEPAAEFRIFNGAGVLTDAVVDVELKGPRKG